MGFAKKTKARIIKTANELSDCVGIEALTDAYIAVRNRGEFSQAELFALCRLAEVYFETKQGRMTRADAADAQRVILDMEVWR
ncbi:MAG: hypothetical protein SOS24_03115 [Clostridia bacterium]|nr:hypothetical protein [Clostridia bacterium]